MSRARAVGVLVVAFAGCIADGYDQGPGLLSDASVTQDASEDTETSAQDAGTLRDICDGDDEIRFALRLVGGHGPQLAPDMMTSIGFSYLYVLGDCRYWVNPGVYYQWEETRTGMLTRAQEQELSRAFDYAGWKGLAGYHVGNAGGQPVGTLQAFDGENLIDCDNSCISYGVSLGQALDRFSEEFEQWSQDLWNGAAPSEPALRVLVERFALSAPLTDLDLEVVIPWPFAWSLDELLAGRESSGWLLADDARVRDLRELRSTYVGKGPLPDGKPNPFLRVEHFGFFVGDDLTTEYDLWFRDALPFETGEGEIPFPSRRR